jgi:hypothetical protein
MAKRKNDKKRQPQPEKDPALQAIYDKIRREFSAADLQKYTEIEEGIPAEQVLAEMRAIHRKIKRQKRV